MALAIKKSIFKSKTFWFGLITAIAPVFPEVQEVLKESPELLGGLWGFIAIFLRTKTKESVSLKGGEIDV